MTYPTEEILLRAIFPKGIEILSTEESYIQLEGGKKIPLHPFIEVISEEGNDIIVMTLEKVNPGTIYKLVWNTKRR